MPARQRTIYGVCGVCASHARGYGYAPASPRNAPPVWVCDDPDCLSIARQTYHMTQKNYDECEAKATRDAGQAAGALLDKIGKTDLATLTEEEWMLFCRQMIATYRSQLAWHIAQAHADATGEDKVPW